MYYSGFSRKAESVGRIIYKIHSLSLFLTFNSGGPGRPAEKVTYAQRLEGEHRSYREIS